MFRNIHEHPQHNEIDGLKKLSDPRYIGPGKWDTFMIEASNSTTRKSQEDTCKFIRRQIDNMRCECRDHAKQYMLENPPENMIGFRLQGEEVGLLLWVWMFHNTVNKRLNKTYVPQWDEVYDYYWLKSEAYNVPCSSDSNLKVINSDDIDGIVNSRDNVNNKELDIDF